MAKNTGSSDWMKQYNYKSLQDFYSNWVSSDDDNFYVMNIDKGHDDLFRSKNVLFGDADKVQSDDCEMVYVRNREMWSLWHFQDVSKKVGNLYDAHNLDAYMHNQGGLQNHTGKLALTAKDMNNDQEAARAFHKDPGQAAQELLDAYHNINLTGSGPPAIDYVNYAMRLLALGDLLKGFNGIAQFLGAKNEAGQADASLNHAQLDVLYLKLAEYGSTEKFMDAARNPGSKYDFSFYLPHSKADYAARIEWAKFGFEAIQTIFHVDEAMERYNARHPSASLDDEFNWLAKHKGGATVIENDDILDVLKYASPEDDLYQHTQTQIAGFM